MKLIVIDVKELEKIINAQTQAILHALNHTSPIKAEKEDLLTVEQVAQLLSMTVASVYSLVHKKAIPFCKPSGKRLYFYKKDLYEWIKNGRSQTNCNECHTDETLSN